MEELVVSTLSHSLMITAFVLIMMVVIDYINVQSKSLWADKLKQLPILRIISASIFRIISACLWASTVVLFYTRRMKRTGRIEKRFYKSKSNKYDCRINYWVCFITV